MSVQLTSRLLKVASSSLASKGMDLLSVIFKGPPSKSVEDVAKTLKEKTGIEIADIIEDKLSEEDLTKRKQFELDHQELILKHIKEMVGIETLEDGNPDKDIENAREMQMKALQEDDKVAKRFIYAYSFMVTVLTFSYIFMVSVMQPSQLNEKVVNTALGFLLGVSLSAIIQFFFGSSRGSGDKNNQLSLLTQQLTDMAKRRP